jgi:predicted metal-dependent enzyme (double-stranded beta helix superfamily)
MDLMTAERVMGDIATRLLMENDRVKIWEMDLAPGEESAIHEHTMDYILVVIDGDRIAGVPQPDSAGLYNEYIEVDVEPGNHFYIDKGGIETARNIGNRRYREIAIELKD